MEKPGQRKLKILLVDDDPDTCRMVSFMVEKAGHAIHTTGNGQDALNFLNQERMDVILLDILMPDMDGLTLLEIIRGTSETPILMLSAVSHSEIMQQCYIRGADDYVIKPFTREKLLDRIYRLANKVSAPVESATPSWTMRYWLDTVNHKLVHDGTAISLSDTETLVLEKLMDFPYKVVTDVELYSAGWGTGTIAPRTMEELVLGTVKGLQLKIEEDPSLPKILLISADGYIFSPEAG
jgi:DNA-binding response OmpR family regulator